MQHSLEQSRQRQNSLPKTPTNATPNPGVNGSSLPLGNGALSAPGVKMEPATGGQRVTSSGGSEVQGQNKEMETIHKLVAAIQRYVFVIMLTRKHTLFAIHFSEPFLFLSSIFEFFSSVGLVHLKCDVTSFLFLLPSFMPY